MSDIDLTEAVEAGAQSIWDGYRSTWASGAATPWDKMPATYQVHWREQALPIVTAAAPVIEAAVWNAAADFVDAQRDEEFGADLRQVRDRLRSIARDVTS